MKRLYMCIFPTLLLCGCVVADVTVNESEQTQESIQVTRGDLDQGPLGDGQGGPGGAQSELDADLGAEGAGNGEPPRSLDAEVDLTVALPCPPQSACDDGDPCTYDDHCEESGQRCVGTVITCQSSECVDRVCNGTSSCVETFTTQSCDDGDLCTYGDVCQRGECRGTTIACTSSTCVERTCNGTSSCAERFTTQGCDDGDACTHTDRCQEGTCRGQSITCRSDECVSRSCNGTSSCAETVHSGRACGGSTTCYPRSCNREGLCAGGPVADGSDCGSSAAQRCCQGQCVDLSTDAANCGGCGLSCADGYRCYPFNQNTGLCGCIGNGNCRGSATCYNPGGGARCNCQADGDCMSGQTCSRVSGHNYCLY